MNKNILKKAVVGAGLGLSLLLPLVALAQSGQLPGPIVGSPERISGFITWVMNFITGIILTVAIIMLLFSAFLYMTAGGSDERVARAKNYLIYSIVGIVVAVLAFSVAPFIIALVGRGS